MDKHFRVFHVNNIYACLEERKSKALPFSGFSGCDKTSTFFGKGKKLAWQAWQTCTDATEAMVHLADALFKNLDACW